MIFIKHSLLTLNKFFKPFLNSYIYKTDLGFIRESVYLDSLLNFIHLEIDFFGVSNCCHEPTKYSIVLRVELKLFVICFS